MPFLSPNQQCHSTDGKISHSMDLLTPSSPGVFQLCLWPLIAPSYLGGGLPCLSSALWCQYPNFRELHEEKSFKLVKKRETPKESSEHHCTKEIGEELLQWHWYVGGADLTGALHSLEFQLSSPLTLSSTTAKPEWIDILLPSLSTLLQSLHCALAAVLCIVIGPVC